MTTTTTDPIAVIRRVLDEAPTEDERNDYTKAGRWAVGPVGTLQEWRMGRARLGWELTTHGTIGAIAAWDEWRAAYAVAGVVG